MGLFNKLKEILFDEETVEIPVITKEDKREAEPHKRVKDSKSETKPDAKRSSSRNDEVIIEKIETPKRDYSQKEDTLYDMPKFKEEPNLGEPVEEKKINTFTFPVFEDDEKRIEKRSEKKTKPECEEPKRVESSRIKKENKERSSGYTNAYDYSYGKYKGDYMSNRENNQDYLTKTLEKKDEKKAFKPSPIISPVYGVLNENYKKEDIISKSEKTVSKGILDLDSVRRKAYGTLEDEIEDTMSKEIVREEVFTDREKTDSLDDSGISIDDLLVDDLQDGDLEPLEEIEIASDEDDTELFSVLDEDDDETDMQSTIDRPKETKEFGPVKIRRPELDNKRGPLIPDDAEEIKIEEKNDKDGAIGEEDLFDLIDSLYQGKDEE